MFPLMLGLLALVGLAINDPHVRAQVERALLNFFPSDAAHALHDALDGIRRYSGVLGAVGLAGLLWSGSSLFTGLEWVLGRMIGARQRDFLRQRAMTLALTVVFTLVIVLVVVANSLVSLAGGAPAVGPIAALLVWIGFTLAVYRAVPNHTYRVAQAWPGAVLAGGLMELLSLAWPLYTRLVHGFNTYGAALALFFVLATWLYFWAQFLLIGAVFNRMRLGPPTAHGLVASAEPQPLETEATRAADEAGRRRAAA
jgi:uncharacterized BrkB/YihY/UPF0761 family membrane protein